MGFCSCTTKYILFLFNIICAIAGLVILVTGIISNQNGKSFKALIEGQMSTGSIALIVIGAIVFVIAFFGCCGAIREDSCMITTYAVLLLVILISEIAIGIYIFMNRNTAYDQAKKFFDDSFLEYDQYKDSIDAIQKGYQCCGVQGYQDWGSHGSRLPLSCCKLDIHAGDTCPSNQINHQGCEKPVLDSIKKIFTLLGGVAIGIAALEFLAVVSALCLANSIRRHEKRGYA